MPCRYVTCLSLVQSRSGQTSQHAGPIMGGWWASTTAVHCWCAAMCMSGVCGDAKPAQWCSVAACAGAAAKKLSNSADAPPRPGITPSKSVKQRTKTPERTGGSVAAGAVDGSAPRISPRGSAGIPAARSGSSSRPASAAAAAGGGGSGKQAAGGVIHVTGRHGFGVVLVRSDWVVDWVQAGFG